MDAERAAPLNCRFSFRLCIFKVVIMTLLTQNNERLTNGKPALAHWISEVETESG
jgi:hypothetical protein